MEKSSKRTEISELGEFGLIKKLTSKYHVSQSSTIKGVGDDGAVLDFKDKLTVVSTDMLVEGIHFDLMYAPLKHLGYKCVTVNLSDIYAMNAIPSQITISLGLSNRFSVEAVESLYEGIYNACTSYGVDLVGGDTTSSKSGLIISVTALGTAERGKVVYRNTARAGDLICVSGDLGAAYLGLQILEREKRLFLEDPTFKPDLKEFPYLIERQLKPEARRDIVAALHKQGVVPTSMIDVSDGLASELFHLCTQSNVGAFLEEASVPIHPESEQVAISFYLDPITCALNGGEDYELLFTIQPADLERVRYMADIAIIGEITTAKEGVTLRTKGGNIHSLKAQGWKHF